MSNSKPPSRRGSGEHPIVIEFRKKLDSLEERTLPDAKEIAERIERLKEKSDRPPPEKTDDDQEKPP